MDTTWETRPGMISGRTSCTRCGYETSLAALERRGPECPGCAARLAREHGEMVALLKDVVESLSRLPDVDGAYRQTMLNEARALLARIEAP